MNAMALYMGKVFFANKYNTWCMVVGWIRKNDIVKQVLITPLLVNQFGETQYHELSSDAVFAMDLLEITE